MKCKLCGCDGTLVRKSHIIPDFMYKDLFDPKHRLHEVRITEEEELKSRLKQTGAYQGQLLCPYCDNTRIGRLETYARKVLYGGTAISLVNVQHENGTTSTKCSEINYSTFKLFLLSVIWRASVSSLPLFNGVDLGEHEGRIRSMILEDSPGDWSDYPCLLLTYIHQKEVPHQLISEPNTVPENGGLTCFIMIAGVLYIYFVGHDRLDEWVAQCVLKENGEMTIPHLAPHLAGKALNRLMGIALFNEKRHWT